MTETAAAQETSDINMEDAYINLLETEGFSPEKRQEENLHAVAKATSKYIDMAGPQFLSELVQITAARWPTFRGSRKDLNVSYLFVSTSFLPEGVNYLSAQESIRLAYECENIAVDYTLTNGKINGHSSILYKGEDSLKEFIRSRTELQGEIIVKKIKYKGRP